MVRPGEPENIGFRMQGAQLRKVARQNLETQVTRFIFSCAALVYILILVAFLTFVVLYNHTENQITQICIRGMARAFLLLGLFVGG